MLISNWTHLTRWWDVSQPNRCSIPLPFDICKLFRQQMGLQEWEPPFTMLFPDSYKAFCNKKIILGKKSRAFHTSSPLKTPAVAATCFVGWMSTNFKPTRALTLPSRYPGPSKMQLLSLTPETGCGVKVFLSDNTYNTHFVQFGTITILGGEFLSQGFLDVQRFWTLFSQRLSVGGNLSSWPKTNRKP